VRFNVRFDEDFDAGSLYGALVGVEGRSGSSAGDGLAERVSDDDAIRVDDEAFVGLETKSGSNPQDQSVSSD